MTRLMYLALLGLLAGLAACGQKTVERDPDGHITTIVFSDGAPPGTCYVMSLSPALLSVTGDYSPGEAVCYVFPRPLPETYPLLHLENQSTTDHLYTARTSEITEAAQWGYAFRDTTCYVYPSPAPGCLPLYRLCKHGTWCHFYTIDEAERDRVIRLQGFTDEGIACYVPQDPVEGARILYRLRKTPHGG